MADRPLLSVVKPSQAPPAASALTDVPNASVALGAQDEPPTLADPGSGRGTTATRLGVLVVVAALGALATGPRLVKGDLPIDDDLLGAPARVTVRADRDYVVVDDVATAALRLAARQKALPVWDINEEEARRDATVVQKSLVRLAVALEEQRRALDPVPAEPTSAVVASLDKVRAVVAGELSSVGLEAPADDAWRALLSLVWARPSTVDALGELFAAEMTRPSIPPSQRGFLPGGPISVRAIGAARDERTLDPRDLLQESVGRAAVRASMVAALGPAPPTVTAATWNSWSQRVAAWALLLPRATLTWNAAESEARARAAADAVPPVVVRAHRGEILLRPGEPIDVRHLLLARAMSSQQRAGMQTRATIATAIFIALVCVVVYFLGARRVFQRRLHTKDLVYLATLLTLQLLCLVGADALVPALSAFVPGISAASMAFAAPVACGAMCARATLSPDVALLFALVFALLGGVLVEPGMSWAVVAALSSMTGAGLVAGGPRRWTMLLAGAGAGLVGVCGALTLEVFRGALVGRQLVVLLASVFLGGLLSGVLTALVLPLAEAGFGYVTDRRLSQLADLNHPLLKDLIVHAPRTWHHSVRTAVLAERAAVAAGANPLLARVMALYHDVGEISAAQAARASLEPERDRMFDAEARATVGEHVEHGLALVRRYRLPDAVAAVIQEHHADVLARHTVGPSHAGLVLEVAPPALTPPKATTPKTALTSFHIRAPLGRESALVLLADQIEDAARGMEDIRNAAFDDVVDRIVHRALTNDVLSSCDLSMRDLARVRTALKAGLRELSRGAPGPAGDRSS
jgi:putative nucleotidyltransferase with HDIG domain